VANLIVAGLEPVYGILFALIFLGEIPTLQALLGGLLIIGSTLQVTFRSSSP
jgi:drug/metabolite transporter (DMT)-like permease